ncbi:MAG: transglycosylase SLT domain-containing protein [Bacteroidetes bacterium]|nr:transglycosylase SLT domain-containing protein [Bacteroidota bacterium]
MRISLLVLVLTTAKLFGQGPEVPHKMNFAGMTLTIRDDAREEIQKDVDALTQSPKYFEVKADRARTYFPIIEKIFSEENIPDDFKYLALQESALVADAVSSSNAIGYWQFKEATATDFGLVVNGKVDERMNIASATRGAARYFKKSNTYFNNWILVIQSYQMGIGGTMRSVGEKFNGDRHMEINRDTYWYVKKFLAHKVAFENKWKGEASITLRSMEVDKEYSLEEIAKKEGVDRELLRSYNLWLKADKIPGDRVYAVLVPGGTGRLTDPAPVVASKPVVEKKEAEVKTTPTVPVTVAEVVNGLRAIRARKGEALVSVAARGQVTSRELIKWNDYPEKKSPSEGEIFYLEKKNRSAEVSNYETDGKESLLAIGQKYGVQLRSLEKANPGLPDGLLPAGTKIYFGKRADEGGQVARAVAVDPAKPFEWGTPDKD